MARKSAAEEHVVERRGTSERRSGTGTRTAHVGEMPVHGALLDLQRLAGNRAVAHHLQRVRLQRQTTRPSEPYVLQRHLDDDWRANSGGRVRSKELKAIDAAVNKWKSSGKQLQGNVDLNITELEAILAAIATWRKKASEKNPRLSAVTRLATAVTTEKARFAAIKTKKQQDEAIAGQLYSEFVKMDPELAKYAKRNVVDIKQQRFEPRNQTPMLMALAKARDPQGKLTSEAIAEIEGELRKEEEGYKTTGRSGALEVDPSLSVDVVKNLATKKENTNSLTKATRFPELTNYTAPNAEPKGEVTVAETFGGVSVSVTYDRSDALAATRLSYLKEAIEKVTALGFHVPGLRVYLPKYGRTLSIGKDCTVQRKGGSVPDAVFVAPDFLLLSSSGVNNPKEDQTASGKLKFLSADLDPNGVGTIVHELGHALHYRNDPARFHGLAFSMFSGTDRSGRSYQDWSKEVSEYGSSPREMVAEVFLGLVYGRPFPPEIMEIYQAFGGPPKP